MDFHPYPDDIYVPKTLRSVLEASLKAMTFRPEDQAAIELALMVAGQIDMAASSNSARNVAELSSKLTTLLVELQMTPKARAAIKSQINKEVDSDDTERLLDAINQGSGL